MADKEEWVTGESIEACVYIILLLTKRNGEED